jgi:hypothetical protein
LGSLFDYVGEHSTDLQEWLLTPQPETHGEAPFDWLREGRITEVWRVALSLSSPVYGKEWLGKRDYAIAIEGRLVTRVEPQDGDVDDLADWPDEDES